MSWLDDLDALSQRQDDGGLIHRGHIHYIQQNALDGEFVLKAAIYATLERIPDMISPDLPEQVDRLGDKFEPDDALLKALEEINEGLIMPHGGYEVIQIMRAARDYMQMAEKDA